VTREFQDWTGIRHHRIPVPAMPPAGRHAVL
jgi:hypothetical protein